VSRAHRRLARRAVEGERHVTPLVLVCANHGTTHLKTRVDVEFSYVALAGVSQPTFAAHDSVFEAVAHDKHVMPHSLSRHARARRAVRVLERTRRPLVLPRPRFRRPKTVAASFSSHPRAAQWSVLNVLAPREVGWGCNFQALFDCDACGHEFEMRPREAARGRWCPYCAGQRLCGWSACGTCHARSFASHAHAGAWSSRNEKSPCEVALHSKKKALFDCDACGHEFEMMPHEAARGHWCPYCAGRRLCGWSACGTCHARSFASHAHAGAWSSRNEKSPCEVALYSHREAWFDCDACGHEFGAIVGSVAKGSWCGYCAGRRLCSAALGCASCRARSFAIHPRAARWSSRNEKSPCEVALHSGSKAWFDCAPCGRTFEACVNKVSGAGRWCPTCKCKTEKKVLDWLTTQRVWQVKRQWGPLWCSTEYTHIKNGKPETGRHQYRWDFRVTPRGGRCFVVEIDGPQHHVQVSNWKAPLLTQLRDGYKERCARLRDPPIRVLRLDQPAVLADTVDWRAAIAAFAAQPTFATGLKQGAASERASVVSGP